MKIFWFLGCTWCLVACGGKGDATEYNRNGQAPPAPAIISQTPQKPSDAVPSPNPQQPTVNSQQSPTNSQAPSASGMALISCAQAFDALRAKGCDIDNSDLTECEAAAGPGAPCINEAQALFRCYLSNIRCDASGHVVETSACESELNAIEACDTSTPPVTQSNPTGCTLANDCNDCASSCSECLCLATGDSSMASYCASICSTSN